MWKKLEWFFWLRDLNQMTTRVWRPFPFWTPQSKKSSHHYLVGIGFSGYYAMPSSPGSLFSTSIYSQLCWNCIRKRGVTGVEGRNLRRSLSNAGSNTKASNKRGGQVRRLHHARSVGNDLQTQGMYIDHEIASTNSRNSDRYRYRSHAYCRIAPGDHTGVDKRATGEMARRERQPYE
jgi:hypothetical protein